MFEGKAATNKFVFLEKLAANFRNYGITNNKRHKNICIYRF